MVNGGAEVRFARGLARGLAAGALALAAAGWTAPATAQVITSTSVTDPSQLLGYDLPNDYERGRNIGVLERRQAGYDPIGILYRNWTILPQLVVGPGYVSNVFGAQTGAKSDLTFVERPSLSAYQDFGPVFVGWNAGLRLRQYASQSQADETGAFADLNGKITIDRDNSISARAAFSRAYIEPDSGYFPDQAISPVAFNTFSGVLSGSHQGERVRLVGAVSALESRFENTQAQGGQAIREDYQDRFTIRGTGRAEYGLTPDTAVFAQFGASESSYRLKNVLAQPQRDSHEFRALLGGDFDLSHLARGTIGIGYVDREYDSSFYGTLSGVAADARIEYFPTQLTTVTVELQRLIQDSASADGSPGYFSNVGAIRVDHELLRNFVVSLSARAEYDDYKVIDRTNTIYEVGAGARYLFTRELGLQGDFAYADRTSTGVFPLSLNDARFTLSAILRK